MAGSRAGPNPTLLHHLPKRCVTNSDLFKTTRSVLCWIVFFLLGVGGDKMPFRGQLIAEEMDSFLFSCFLNCWVRGGKKTTLFPTRGEKQSEMLSGL